MPEPEILTAADIYDYYLNLVISGAGEIPGHREQFFKAAADLAGCRPDELDSFDFSNRQADLEELDSWVGIICMIKKDYRAP